MDQELTLRIILENPPEHVDFGLQKGSGRIYETVQTQRSTSNELQFNFTIRVKGNPEQNSLPAFQGAFVQGPSAARFVYIDIGACAGQTDSIWSRRLKIPLYGITWSLIDQLLANDKLVLETRIPGTGKDGGPICGTVKPFAGWQTR
ncbi:hypothetical protein GO755_15000 [Spirosoma sp. HMF4905]|uniref:Uncharacterized protein n=1 Tax=Spirosoma arboris TaxID=2682092 RepID=A0A7K1SC42_9BACT|nr:DUF5990 family protein [Spirosoma arboris]MVM31350.1 hypothetical protein [Spirosoma arboris]